MCTIGGATGRMMTFLTPGVCTVAADQPGNALYNASPQATLSFAVGPAGAPPATFTVTNLGNNGPGSLRDAIAQANLAPGPNIVDFAPGLTGTIVLTGGQIQISGPTQIVGPGAANLTIDGNGILNVNNFSRIFSIFATDPACPAIDGPDYLVSISGLRLTNGRQKSGGSAGAVFTEHSLILDSVVIDNSVARAGGGVRSDVQYAGQTLGIFNSQFLNNTATELVPPSPFNVKGGAVDIAERCANATDTPYTEPVSVTIANSEFRGNSVQPVTQEGRGGALRSWSRADIVITDSIFVDNHVDAPNPPTAGRVYHGGAFDGSMKSLRIERTEVAENSANDATGADVTRSGGLHLHNSQVDRQSPAGSMGVKIIDSTISGNLSSATAGAMVAFGNTALELVNTTVSDNFAAPTRTGGIIMSSGDTYPVTGSITARPTLSVVSSILANNSSAGGDLASNTVTMPTLTINAVNSLVEKLCPTCSIFVTGTGNLLGIDPMLAPLAANGGPSRTQALLPGSPAINAGSNPLGLATDQRGIGFPRVNGGTADMGAYESP
ncbi:MAG: choice-of-anchor Q domain-containing protein [Casimicrobiaceae bacterium]